MRITALTIAFALLFSASPLASAEAQSWLDKAKGALEKTLGGGTNDSSTAGGILSNEEIGNGLKEALRVGTERVVAQVGKPDGFNADNTIHIPLPDTLKKAQDLLRKFGMASLADDLELRLNRAAEQAAPEAKELFLQAIAQMTLDDVQRIYKGPEDAATRYFQDRITPPLGQRMAPIIDQALSEVGAIAAYDAMISQYKSYPLVPDVKADLTKYVVEEAMGGIFHYVAKEEAAIRANPAKRTTELLQRVFGQ